MLYSMNITSEDAQFFSFMDVASKAQQVVLPITAQYTGGFEVKTTLLDGAYALAKHFDSTHIIVGLESIPLLANNYVYYVGQPLALIMADTAWQADLYRQNLTIEYKGKQRLQVDTEDEKTSSREWIDEEIFVQRNVEKGFHIDDVFDIADTIVEKRYCIQRNTLLSDESLGAYACYEEDKIIVYVVTAWSHRLKNMLLNFFHLETDQIEIRLCKEVESQDYCGIHVHLSACYVVWALLKTGKSSRLLVRGKRPFFSSNLSGDLDLDFQLALGTDSEILGIRCRGLFYAGAFAIALDEAVDRMIWALGLRYHKVAMTVKLEARRTNQEPALPDITFGVSSVNYILEHAVSSVKQYGSHRSVKDWSTLLYRRGDIDVFNHEWKHDASYLALIRRLYADSHYARKYDAYQQESVMRSRLDHELRLQPYRGIGMALGELPSGFLRHHYASVQVEVVLLSAHRVEIRTNMSSIEGRIHKPWKKLVAHMLGMQEDQVVLSKINFNDREEILDVNGEAFSLGTNVYTVMSLLQEACEDIQKRRFREHLPIRSMAKDKRYRKWKEQYFEGDLSDRVSRIALSSEVEIDVSTFSVYTRALYIVVDIGRVLQPQAVRSQIEREIQETLLMLHQLKIDQFGGEYAGFKGTFYYDSLSPALVHITFLERRHYSNLIKSRGVSGLIKTVLPIAYTHAVEQALQSSIDYCSVQNEALYLQNQWTKMLKTMHINE